MPYGRLSALEPLQRYEMPSQRTPSSTALTGLQRPTPRAADLSNSTWTARTLLGEPCLHSGRSLGAPRPIAVFSKSLTSTEQAWSAFERELYGIREALALSEPYIKGFQTVLTDHKNNLFTGSLLSNRRVNNKLLR